MNHQRHDWRAGQATNAAQPQYWAFLSYSHRDKAFADWLHNALEAYRVPKKLVGRVTAAGPIPEKLSPVFRDRFELAASDDLGSEIRSALAGSRYLIVLCSPDAATSRWTNEEIRTFKQLHPGSHVLAAIVSGEPFASRRPGTAALECFPEALRHRYDEQGRQLDDESEPIAADFRPEGDGKRLGLLKLVAGMIGVGLDDLIQREAHRRQKRLAWLSAASLLGMLVTSSLAVVAIDGRNDARGERVKAEQLVGFMLEDLRGQLETLGRLDVLDSVGVKALDYYRGQDKGRLSDEALTQRSRALTLIGEIANRRGNLDAALSRYREALAGTAEALRRNPEDGQRVFDHAQNVFWVGYIAWQRGQSDEAERAFVEYRRLAQQLLAIDPRRAEWRLESVYADTNLGTLLLERRQFGRAVQTFQHALRESEALAAAAPRSLQYQNQVGEALANLADAQLGLGQLEEALASRERQLALLTRVSAADRASPSTLRKIVAAERATADLLASRGEAESALARLRNAAALAEQLRRTEPENTEWLHVAALAHADIGHLLLDTGRADEAGPPVRASCGIWQRLADRDGSVVEWRLRGLGSCFLLRAKAAAARGHHRDALALAQRGIGLWRGASPAPHPRVLISLHLVAGEQHAAISDANAGQALWRSALSLLGRGAAEPPHHQALRSEAMRMLGHQQEADAVRRRLEALGYRHPWLFRQENRPIEPVRS